MPVASAGERLKRILVLVPWVMAHEGVTVDEVCTRFGITRDELTADLDMLFMCGLPPFGPGDLIEAFIDGDEVVIRMADYLARPPRLTRSEAIGLLVMGRAVVQLPGIEEADALRRALAKLSAAIAPDVTDPSHDVVERIEVDLASPGVELLGVIRRAIVERQTLRLTYYSAGRAQQTERDVDPWVVFSAVGYWYVAAFDHRSGEERTFRLDRIRECAATGATFRSSEGYEAAQHAGEPTFAPFSQGEIAVIDVDPSAAWLREAIPFETETAIDGGGTRLDVRTMHLAWLVRLLLAAGPGAHAVSPPELVAEVRDAARRALARYADRTPFDDGSVNENVEPSPGAL